MTTPNAIPFPVPAAPISAFLGGLSHLTSPGPDDEQAKDELIAELLNYASHAEQQMAEQQARIERLETLYETDELTGLLNRRGFNRVLHMTLDQANRHGDAGLLALLDLDGFKPINDRYGHHAGDHVLRMVARFLTEQVRSSDYVARLGGDEFAIILTRADAIGAKARLVDLQARLTSLAIPYEGKSLMIGASIGFRAYGPASEPEALLRAADEAMYKIKARKNTV